MPRINWDDVPDAAEAGNREPFEGRFHVEVIAGKTDNHNGKDVWKMRYRVMAGPKAGRWIFDDVYLTDAAMWRLKKLYSRLGVRTEGAADIDPSDLLGRQMVVDVVIETYSTGRASGKRQKVTDYISLSEAGVVQASAPVSGGGDLGFSEGDVPF